MRRPSMLAAILVGLAMLTAASSASAMYHPTLGRWAARDTGADAAVKPLYQYGASNPVHCVDPEGLAEAAFEGFSGPVAGIDAPGRGPTKVSVNARASWYIDMPLSGNLGTNYFDVTLEAETWCCHFMSGVKLEVESGQRLFYSMDKDAQPLTLVTTDVKCPGGDRNVQCYEYEVTVRWESHKVASFPIWTKVFFKTDWMQSLVQVMICTDGSKWWRIISTKSPTIWQPTGTGG